MTEKWQNFTDNCFRVFSVLDQLDQIGDSDNDIDDLPTNSKQRRRHSGHGTEDGTPVQSNEFITQTDRNCDNVGKPTKGLIDGQNPLEVLSTEQFVNRYRFSKECVEDILQMIAYGLTKFTNRGKPFPPIVQLLITLQFLATGRDRKFFPIRNCSLHVPLQVHSKLERLSQHPSASQQFRV